MAGTAQANAAGAPAAASKVNPWELAHAGGCWMGDVPAQRFGRLQAAVSSLAGDVRVDLRFTLDDGGGCQVVGSVGVAAELTCERCLDTVPYQLSAEINALAVVGEDAAECAAALGRDVCVLAGRATCIEALVEDDLLLSLPTQVCAEPEHCPHAPGLSFPAQTAAVRRPFAALATLHVTNDTGQP